VLPGIPASPSPADGASNVPNDANLDWADAAGATSYDIYFGASSPPPLWARSTSSNYTLPVLSCATQYFWKIVARNACGDREGPEWDFTTAPGLCLAPGAPSDPSPAHNSDKVPVDADLDWGDADRALTYDVYFGTSSPPPYLGATATSSFGLTPLAYGTRYYWRIVAKNQIGATSGPLWQFSTLSSMKVYLPVIRR
jgi:hypothetical protein